MVVRESDLPGIGRKFEIMLHDKDKLIIIVHDDGRREIHHFKKKNYDEPVTSITFNDQESRQFAAILGGIIYKPKALESIEVAFDELIIEWFKVEQGAKATNKSIGEIDIRNLYDVTIISIIKNNNQKLLNPGPEAVIEPGDTLIVSGERKKMKTFIYEQLSRGE